MPNLYCEKAPVKDRMLIVPADTSYDDSLNVAIEEASRLVDIFLKPYVEVPLTTPDDQVKAITADFAASIFKRRTMPDEVKIRGALQPDMINEIDAVGWFAQGIKKIEQYIKAYHVLGETVGNTVHNPDIYIALFEKGLITGKEARAFINANTAIAVTKIESLTKNIDITETRTSEISEDITRKETVEEYRTKKQKSFVFVSGDKNTEGYKEDSEYYGT